MCGSTRGLAASGGRATLDCENSPHVAWTPACWPSCSSSSRPSCRCTACSRCCPSRGRSSTWRRLWQRLAGCGHLACPLALCSGHEVVIVAVATSKPELLTCGADNIKVVAWCPSTAGAGGARQGADGALDYSKEIEHIKLATCKCHQYQYQYHLLICEWFAVHNIIMLSFAEKYWCS